MIEIATNRSWKANKKPRHNNDAKYGWYRYETRFAIENVNGDYDIYKAHLLIRNAKNGKKYLYDMINIKREHPSIIINNKNATRSGSENRTTYIDALSSNNIAQESGGR